MITDPTTLIALAVCIGILGITVLILPLMILFWSQMQPQLLGLVSDQGGCAGGDDYPTQAVLPRLMKSFGTIAEQDRAAGGREGSSKPAAQPKSSARSKASSSNTKTAVKAAPGDAGKAKSKSAKPKAKTSSKSGSAKKPGGSAAKASKAKAVAKPKKKVSSKAGSRSKTPTGAKRDPILGVIFTKKPKEIDDLKQIKGVAKVIEGKLHKAGIYTFRQIVEWDDSAIDAISEKLAFKGRIRNEGWQKQCAKFHKEKYGEKIS